MVAVMKINIEVDCTPEEARRFLGLPDVAPMQERLLKSMEERMRDAVTNGDVKAMLDQWLPFGARGVDHWQTMWKQMAETAAGIQKAADKAKKGDLG